MKSLHVMSNVTVFGTRRPAGQPDTTRYSYGSKTVIIILFHFFFILMNKSTKTISKKEGKKRKKKDCYKDLYKYTYYTDNKEERLLCTLRTVIAINVISVTCF